MERAVISTAGRALTGPEARMFITEIEVAAIYFALQKFRDYVFNQKVVVKSDNISLAFLQKCRLTSSRISRYIHKIMSYNVDIQHVKGIENIFADTLSRLPRAPESHNRIENRDLKEVVVMRVGVTDRLNLKPRFKELGPQQRLAPELAALTQNAPEIGSPEANGSSYRKKDGLLYKKTGQIELVWKVCLPKHMAGDLIRAYHEHLGHSGSESIFGY